MERAEKLQAIANYINGQLDVPAVPEWLEQRGADWLVGKLDPVLPDRVLDVMVSATDGLDETEQRTYGELFAHYLDTKYDVPLLGDETEAMVFGKIAGVLMQLLAAGVAAV